MKKIMFVCYGNICRSPLAEFLFKRIVKESGEEKDFLISSSAISYEEIGNPVYPPIAMILDRENIDYSAKRSQKLLPSDYDRYDYFIGMDVCNFRDMVKIFNGDKKHKVFTLLDFTNNPRDVADPWYTRDFEKAYQDILMGVSALYKKLKQ